MRLFERGVLNCSHVGLKLWEGMGEDCELQEGVGVKPEPPEIPWGGKGHTQGATSCWAPPYRGGIERCRNPQGQSPKKNPRKCQEKQKRVRMLSSPSSPGPCPTPAPLQEGRAVPPRVTKGHSAHKHALFGAEQAKMISPQLLP